ncbi:MAG: hypothetical protein JOZ27_02280 [Caulobacteraceae bacterium]|nr:hypothetical protein [Caulobacteraceae bacterium]
MTMTNDPTTTPAGEADTPQSSLRSSRSRSNARSSVPYPEMMGDGTEEQNLNQPGDPSKRITEDEVREAFKDKDKGKAG